MNQSELQNIFSDLQQLPGETEVVEFKEAKKLPDWMDDKQKKNKINNLLSELRRKGKIKNSGSQKTPKWVLDS